MSKFSSSSESKWIDPKQFDLNKVCVLEVHLKYPKELNKLHDDYPFAPVKIEIKREMLSEYQLKISDSYNIPIGIVKNLVHNLKKIKKRFLMKTYNFTWE